MINTIVWFACLVGILIIPIVTIVLGKTFRDNPPKEINGTRGYRSRRSMASQEAWDFANRLMGKIYFIAGLCLLPISIVVHLFFMKSSIMTMYKETIFAVLAQAVLVVMCSIPVERSLKERF